MVLALGLCLLVMPLWAFGGGFCLWFLSDADGRTGRLGNDSGPLERIGGRPAGPDAWSGLSIGNRAGFTDPLG